MVLVDFLCLPNYKYGNNNTIINLLSKSAPWLVGLLAVCALAAMQSTGAAYMSTFSGMVTRDIYKKYISTKASDKSQKNIGRLFVIIVTTRIIKNNIIIYHQIVKEILEILSI